MSKMFEIQAYACNANFSPGDVTWHFSVMFVSLSFLCRLHKLQWVKWINTYVDAVLVRRVIIGLGNCNCELWIERFGELSGDDILLDQNGLKSSAWFLLLQTIKLLSGGVLSVVNSQWHKYNYHKKFEVRPTKNLETIESNEIIQQVTTMCTNPPNNNRKIIEIN